jgi:hypothetical protein
LDLGGLAFKIKFNQLATTDFEGDLLQGCKWPNIGRNWQKTAQNSLNPGKNRKKKAAGITKTD